MAARWPPPLADARDLPRKRGRRAAVQRCVDLAEVWRPRLQNHALDFRGRHAHMPADMLQDAIDSFNDILSPPFRGVMVKSVALTIAVLAIVGLSLDKFALHSWSRRTAGWRRRSRGRSGSA